MKYIIFLLILYSNHIYCQLPVSSICKTNPCKNGGKCLGLSENAYLCTCLSNFSGANCEICKNICFKINPLTIL